MKELFLTYLSQHIPAKELFEKLLSCGNIYLIGGVLREYKDHDDFIALRDIDITIEVADPEYFKYVINCYSMSNNRFGGHKFYCDDLLIDVWPIEDTWAYKEKIISCPRSEYLSRLTDTVFLNIDGIVYDWKNSKWYEEKYLNAVKNRLIDVVLPENPLLLLNILRAFILKRRYHMSLSEDLAKIILSEYHKYSDINQFTILLNQEQTNRYNGVPILSIAEIQMEILNLINMNY